MEITKHDVFYGEVAWMKADLHFYAKLYDAKTASLMDRAAEIIDKLLTKLSCRESHIRRLRREKRLLEEKIEDQTNQISEHAALCGLANAVELMVSHVKDGIPLTDDDCMGVVQALNIAKQSLTEVNETQNRKGDESCK